MLMRNPAKEFLKEMEQNNNRKKRTFSYILTIVFTLCCTTKEYNVDEKPCQGIPEGNGTE